MHCITLQGNGDLLLLYGFALERNPFNSVDITVGLSKEDPMYNQKKAFLDGSGRGASSVRFPLQQNRYPSELVDFLRLLLVEPEDLGMQQLDRVDFNEPISPSLERRVLTTMVSICESYLEQYPTKVEEDETLMRDRQLFGALSRQQRMAVKLRASEKRILEATIRAVNDELRKLPSIVSVDDEDDDVPQKKVIAAGRSFDRPRPNVATAKNAADWVDFKGEKPKVGAAAGDDAAGSVAERRRRRRSGQ